MPEPIYSLYIIWYVFLAGMGGGAFCFAMMFKLVGHFATRERIKEYGHLAEGGLYIGPILVLVGAVFLLFDLGKPENAVWVLLTSNITVLSFGTWIIFLFCPVAFLLVLLQINYSATVSRVFKTTLQILGLVLSLGLVGYTGVFFACTSSIPFHNNWVLVLLFTLSSLSTGASVIALYGFLSTHKKAMFYSLNLMPKMDLALIVLEFLSLTAFLVMAFFNGETARLSLNVLLLGEIAPCFWIGVAVVGLVLPFVGAIVGLRTPSARLTALCAIFSIAGGLFLRYTIIAAAVHIKDYSMLIR